MSSPGKNEQQKERRVCLKVYLEKAENERIAKMADQMNISRSKLVLNVIKTGRYPDPYAADLVRELVKLRADLARLGNLQLKGMNEVQNGLLVAEMQSLLKEIRGNQKLVTDAIKEASI